MAKGINRLIGQQQQQNLTLQSQTQGNALSIAGAHNVATMAQTGMTSLLVSAGNAATTLALSGGNHAAVLKFSA
jgi:hypothetical protein